MINLIIIGDELLSGKRQDKHMAKALELLAPYGIGLDQVLYLGDNHPQLIAQLQRSFEQQHGEQDLVICLGGIGATPDDHTRQCAAIACNQPLVLNPIAKSLIQKRIQAMAAEGKAPPDLMHPDNLMRLRMGEWAQSAVPVENPYNHIPGFQINRHFFLPGFPVMSWPMMAAIFAQAAQTGVFTKAVLHQASFFVLNMPESQLSHLLYQQEANHLIKTVSLPSFGDASYQQHATEAWRAQPHIEIGVKSMDGTLVEPSLAALKAAVAALGYDVVIA